METAVAQLTEFMYTRALPIGVVCVVMVVAYLSILAYVQLRTRYVVEYYRRLKEEVGDMRRRREEGESVERLEGFETLEGLLRKVLEEERVLPKEQ